MNHLPAYNLDEARGAFPISEQLIYLNHASISPVPAPARLVMMAAVERLTSDPGSFFGPERDPLFGDIFFAYSSAAGTLINAPDMRDIVPVQSTSAGINAIAQSIDWQPGDNVVFARAEFPSNAYPWMVLARRGVECRIVPLERGGGASVAAFEPYVDEHTRVIAVSAVQFLTGHRADLAALGAFCHARNILFVVDAIQAAGHMPIDVQAMQIDVLAAGGQKSLMGPPGQGFLYVRDAVANELQPASVGPNATENWEFWSDYDLTPRRGAYRFLMGTVNVIGMVGGTESIRFLSGLGLAHIDAWTRHLSEMAFDVLAQCGCTVITPRDAYGPIVTFRLSDPDPGDADAVRRLDAATARTLAALTANNVRVTRHLDMYGVPHLRISTHCYNTEDEVRRVSAILEEQHG